jgi:hypothetical protein
MVPNSNNGLLLWQASAMQPHTTALDLSSYTSTLA